jgi:Holliday junction resolvase
MVICCKLSKKPFNEFNLFSVPMFSQSHISLQFQTENKIKIEEKKVKKLTTFMSEFVEGGENSD